MESKSCSKCNNTKPLNEFVKHKNTKSGYGSQCKQCVREYNKNRYKTHSHVWKKYWADNKEYYGAYHKEYIKNNPEKKSKYIGKEYYKNKYNNDLEYRLIKTLRSRIYTALKNNYKNSSSKEILGCDLKDYIVFLENQFDKHMNWDNYGEYWEIDHIKQINTFSIKNITEAFHYLNTRPLEIIENKRRPKK